MLPEIAQEARAAGCRTSVEAERYIEQKMKTELEENARRVKENPQAGLSGKYLQRLNHQKGDQDTNPSLANMGITILDTGGKDTLNTISLSGSSMREKWDVSGLLGADLLSEAVSFFLYALEFRL